MKSKKKISWCDNFPMECTCNGRGNCTRIKDKYKKKSIERVMKEKL